MELLDDVKIEKRRKPIFASLAIVSPILVLLLIAFVGQRLETQDEIPYDRIIAYLIIGLFIFGAVSLLFSFVRKEKPIFLIWIASVLYFLLILSAIVVFIYDL